MMGPIATGETIQLSYPTRNCVGGRARYQTRLLRVESIRDLVRQPLSVEEFLRRPLLARSRLLLQATDLEQQCRRQFYLGVAREHERPGLLRVALYRRGGQRPVDLISRPFGPTPTERRVLARVIREWQDAELGQLQLRVIADDLGLVCVA